MQRIYLLLADLVLITHTMTVLFIAGGFVLIWIGHFRNWSFVRNFYFRLAHLLAIGFVAVQSLLGEICPLTILENLLRMKAGVDPQYEGSFIGHWLSKILFFEFGLATFALIYTLFFVLVAWTFFWVRPQSPRKSRETKND